MKRSPLKRKTTLKRKWKRRKKSQTTLIQEELWELCKTIIRTEYGNECYTCRKKGLFGAGWHTGHFIPKSTCGAFLKYDLRNLRPQCYYCNINLGGNGAIFYKRLVEEEGQKYVDKLFKDKEKVIEATPHYKKLIAKYKKKISSWEE